VLQDGGGDGGGSGAAAGGAGVNGPPSAWPPRFLPARASDPAPAARWLLENVTLEMPRALRCFAPAGGLAEAAAAPRGRVGIATSSRELKALLGDAGVDRIELRRDVEFDETTWPRNETDLINARGLNVTHAVRRAAARPGGGGGGSRDRGGRVWGFPSPSRSRCVNEQTPFIHTRTRTPSPDPYPDPRSRSAAARPTPLPPSWST
jgi:hypothetical protein